MRAELQHQRLAQQIRRRQMANQASDQPQYYRRSRYEEEQRDRQREEYFQRRSPTFDEFFEEVIEERLL